VEPAERALLETTVRDAFTRAAAREGAAAAVDDELAALGWLEMLATEPRAAVEVVFTALGATGCTAGALDDVVAAAIGLEPRPGLALVLPPFGGWDCPARRKGDAVRGSGLATARAPAAADLLVVCECGGAVEQLVLASGRARVAAVGGIDPHLGLHTVSIDTAEVSAVPAEPGVWDAAIAAARRALAHQIAGACRTMLDQARSHAVERVQFGRPIAHFQAVRHRLADTLVAIEALEATLVAAWDEPGAMTAALAKASAGQTARTVGAHCQQVLAGIGFTTDHPFHRFLKRTMALEGLFGHADDIVLDLGRALVAERHVPTVIEL
jgi:hypothetical protein